MMQFDTKYRPTVVAAIFLVLLVVLAGTSLVLMLLSSRDDRALQSLLDDARDGIYGLVVYSEQAVSGVPESYDRLNRLHQDMGARIQSLVLSARQMQSGGLEGGQVSQVSANFNLLSDNISNDIIGQRAVLSALPGQVATLKAGLAGMGAQYSEIADALMRSQATTQAARAREQQWRLERLIATLESMRAGNAVQAGAQAQIDLAEFRRIASDFRNMLDAMISGNARLGIARVQGQSSAQLRIIRDRNNRLAPSMQQVGEALPVLENARRSVSAIPAIADLMQISLQNLSAQVDDLSGNILVRPFSSVPTVLTLFALSLVFFIILLGVLYLGTRRNLETSALTNANQQAAVFRLLDDIGAIGKGNFTVQAAIDEEFTGAIADSLNSAVEQLRGLVLLVRQTVSMVIGTTNETRGVTQQLVEAADHQAEEISTNSREIDGIAKGAATMSSDSERAVAIANRSVDVAAKGAAVVQRTISGMNSIRGQIQDTQKRLKRLGESSQEIGNIVAFIGEIADQTNMLSLNASIQAVIAGESGRGFAAVADEVQHLAERAVGASKQIENLVQAIQIDAKEAVASMESTTAEVVRGTETANHSGNALRRIQDESTRLAQSITGISKGASEKARRAQDVAKRMTIIKDITDQTLEGNKKTHALVGEVVRYLGQLRDYVARFQLPEAIMNTGAKAVGTAAEGDAAKTTKTTKAATGGKAKAPASGDGKAAAAAGAEAAAAAAGSTEQPQEDIDTVVGRVMQGMTATDESGAVEGITEWGSSDDAEGAQEEDWEYDETGLPIIEFDTEEKSPEATS